MMIPRDVQRILDTLTKAGHEAAVVGGCVRDLLRNVAPADWDVATSARPEEIQKLFPHHRYENRFGTVLVLTGNNTSDIAGVEVTTYRTEEAYTDQRHPDRVVFTPHLEDDLARRDFTVNAMALRTQEGHQDIVDPFDGQADLAAGTLRAVGDPSERFNEDALRLVRAVRLSVTLKFEIEKETLAAIRTHANDIARVSQERIRDEFVKMILADDAERGVILLQETGLLAHIIPELSEGVGVLQNKHHIYTVFDHNVKSLGFSAHTHDPLHIRLAALFHDIGKPRTKQGESPDATFHGHDIVGAAMTRRLMQRLRFSNDMTMRVAHLVRQHLFMYDVGVVTEAGVRRLLRRVGPENFADLIKVRMAERLGSGVPKARPYRLRHLEFMAEKVQKDPLSTKMLTINGHDLMQELHFEPGPKIGALLEVLLADVVEDPTKNTRESLLARAKELQSLDLSALRAAAKDVVAEQKEADETEIRRRYHV